MSHLDPLVSDQDTVTLPWFPILMPPQERTWNQSDGAALDLALIMERKVLANKWGGVQWEAIGVVPDRPEEGGAPRCLRDTEQGAQWLFPGFRLELFGDQAENYLLNVTAPEPRIFVMWQMEDSLPMPMVVTVSYGEAAAMMDSNEQVDGVTMPADIRDWVMDFAQRHYRPPEQRKGRRYASQKVQP
jgi:uncharacterized protein DUF3305